MQKKMVMLIALMIVGVGFLSGCNELTNSSEPGISYFITADSNLNNFNYHFENNTFAQGDIVYVYCEFTNLVHDGGYDLSITYKVEQEGITYDVAQDDLTGTISSNLQSHSWFFTTTTSCPPGTYAIYTQIYDKITKSSYSKTEFITLLAIPTASITVNDNLGLAPFEVNFIGTGKSYEGTIEMYSWDFGDGATSLQKNPKHVYESEGTYNVKLTVIDSLNLKRDANVVITVLGKEFTINPTADAYVDSDKDHYSGDRRYKNFGDDSSFEVSYWESLDDETISYLKFDLSEIPSDRIIKSAKLKILCYYASTYKTDSVDVSVHRSTDISWEEKYITWNNKPDYSTASSDTQIIIPVDSLTWESWYEWDVTSYAQSSLSVGKMTLVLDTKSDGSHTAYWSKEAYSNDELPKLSIELI